VIPRQSVPLGRIMGIPIGLDLSWFLVFVLLTWTLAASYYPSEFGHWSVPLYWVMGALTAIMLFVSVVLHELGHSLVALRYGIPVRSITLFIFGGVAQIASEPSKAAAEFVIAIAGPLVSLALAVLFTVLKPVFAPIEPLWGLLKYLAFINFALVLFNLIPGFPLDGGRVLRAVVWAVTKNFRRATMTAAGVGRLFGFFFIIVGVWQMLAGNFGGGLWIAFIGWFLESAASSQMNQVVLRDLLAGHTVSQAMSGRCAAVPENLTLQRLVDDHILEGGRRCLLVLSDQRIIGLITLHRVKQVPRSEWATTAVASVMLPFDGLKRLGPDTGLWTALEQMDRDGVNQLPVTSGSDVIGMLSREDVITYLRTLHDLSVQ